ncbi:MAG: hypothetical protein IJU64_05655 [Bacilli bacterium]|nr:hypothetical protein [Bacilli bacterium]
MDKKTKKEPFPEEGDDIIWVTKVVNGQIVCCPHKATALDIAYRKAHQNMRLIDPRTGKEVKDD